MTYGTASTSPGASRTISFQVNDGAGANNLSNLGAKTIAITDVNSRPTVTTSGGDTAFVEDSTAATIDASLTLADPDTATLVGATVKIATGFSSGEDQLLFDDTANITGSYDSGTGVLTLTGNASLADYQAALRSVQYNNTSNTPDTTTRTLEFVVDDGQGVDNLSTAGTKNVTVAAANDVPVVTTTSGAASFTEDQSLPTVVDSGVALSDADDTNLEGATITITNFQSGQDVLSFTPVGNITGTYDSSTGVLTLSGSDTPANYELALRSVTYNNTSQNPNTTARTISFVVDDGADDSAAGTRTVNVTSVNDAPVVTTTVSSLAYTENAAATAVDSGLTLTDVDSSTLTRATVQITGNFQSTEDVLAFAGNGSTGNIAAGTFDTTTGTLTLTSAGGTATVAQWQAALRAVTYLNTSDNPSSATRTISFQANDGAGANNLSSLATRDVTVTPVNDAPVVDLLDDQGGAQTTGTTAAFTENAGAVTIVPKVDLSDLDSPTLVGATVTLTNAQAGDVLSLQGQAGLSGDLASGIHFQISGSTVSFSNTDSVADYEAALKLVQFNNTSEAPVTTNRSFNIAVDDGEDTNNTGTATATATVTAVNDAPVNSGVPAQVIVHSATPQAITGLSISDVDAGSASNITTTFTAAAGTVAIGNGTSGGNAGISGGATVTANGTGTVTLTGTIVQINASLTGNNVVYTAADTNSASSTTTTLTMTTSDAGNTGQDPGNTGTATHELDADVIQVGVLPQVWFIDSTPPASPSGPLGSQNNPFTTIAQFNASSAGPNDYIYIKEGTYSGDGINLKNGQTLLGDGEQLSLPNPFGGPAILIDAGGGNRPVIHVTTVGDQGVDLASGNTVRGIDVTTATGTTGIDDGTSGVGGTGGSVGNLTISNMAISGAGQAVDIDQAGGTLSVTLDSLSSSGGSQGIQLAGAMSGSFSVTSGGTLSGHTASEIDLSGGSVNVTYGGTIGNGSGLSASIANRTGGSVTLSGSITDTNDAGGGVLVSGNTGGTIDFDGSTKTLNTGGGAAVSLTNNTGATIRFDNGGLDIDTTTGTGFTATGGGTVSVTGSANTINSGTGTALNVANTTIGAADLTFQSISANGAVNGIVLNNTGTSGGLTVTGDGGDTTAAASRGTNSSGGIIQNTTGAGISLTSTLDPSFTNMHILNTDLSGIEGTDVTNFTFRNGKISDSGTNHVLNDSNIRFNTTTTANNLDGNVTITGNLLERGYDDGVSIHNYNGTITSLNVSNNTITSATTLANSQGNGIQIVAFGNASTAANITQATISHNTVTNIPGGVGISVQGGNSNVAGPGGDVGIAGSSTNVISITGNTISGSGVPGPGPLNSQHADLIGSEGILASVQGGNALSCSEGNFDISGNTITNVFGHGISNSTFGNATMTSKVNDNVIDQNNAGRQIGSQGIGGGTGVVGGSPGTSQTPLMTLQVDGNTITDYDGDGIRLVALDTNGTLNATVTDNQIGPQIAAGFPNRIRVDAGNSVGDENNTVNLDIRNNVAINGSNPGTTPGIGLRIEPGSSNTFTIEGLNPPTGATNAQVISYVTGLNPNMSTGSTSIGYNSTDKAEVINGSGFIRYTNNGGDVPLPANAASGLLAAPGGVEAAGASFGAGVLSQAELDFMVDAAIARWEAAGASDEQIATLQSIAFTVADLSGDRLASSEPGQVVIDTDAAGYGWFIDATPDGDFEFGSTASTTLLVTDPTSAPAGNIDLLTTVMHEMGHQLGLDDSYTLSDRDSLMYGHLQTGERRLPDASVVQTANATDGAVDAEQHSLMAYADGGFILDRDAIANFVESARTNHSGNSLEIRDFVHTLLSTDQNGRTENLGSAAGGHYRRQADGSDTGSSRAQGAIPVDLPARDHAGAHVLGVLTDGDSFLFMPQFSQRFSESPVLERIDEVFLEKIVLSDVVEAAISEFITLRAWQTIPTTSSISKWLALGSEISAQVWLLIHVLQTDLSTCGVQRLERASMVRGIHKSRRMCSSGHWFR